MKDTGISWVMQKTQGFFGVLYFSSINSNQQLHKAAQFTVITCTCMGFFGYAENIGIFG